MNAAARAEPARTAIKPTRAPLSTGFKLFLILSLALLPLGLIAFFATLQSNRTADLERQAEMRVALSESTRKLDAAIASDMALLRGAMEAVSATPGDIEICRRLTAVIAAEKAAMPRFALFGPANAPLCAAPGFSPARPSTLGVGDAVPRTALGDDGLAIALTSLSGEEAAVIAYPTRTLAAIGAPGGFGQRYVLVLSDAGGSLRLIDDSAEGGVSGFYSESDDLALAGFGLDMRVPREPFSISEMLSLLLPMLMWIAAAAIGWLVVNRVLIRPLKELEQEVSAYRLGEVLELGAARDSSAQELNQLGKTFYRLTRMVSTHEAELAQGLERQTKLTREVHHRVKNNLQVIASLINLHARTQKLPAVIDAYATIQRRVDALAVVHRNHFAELEVNRGVSMRALIGELAQNFRGSLAEGAAATPITLDLCPCYASQDVAMPIAFLLTELIELSMTGDRAAPIAIALSKTSAGKAQLSVASSALAALAGEGNIPERYSRVLEGLSRQLRAKLETDVGAGCYTIEISISPEGQT